MKSLIVFICLMVAANALTKDFVDKFMEEMQKVGAKCQAETKASDDDVAELVAKKIPATHEGKCMIFCFHKHFKMQGDDGALLKDGTASMAPIKENDANVYDIMVQSYNFCLDAVAKDNDPCITAANFAECAMKKSKELGLDEFLLD